MEKLDGKSFNVVEDNISKLKEIFPEIFSSDNQIDFNCLKELLEKDMDVIDELKECYTFNWWGKKEAKNLSKLSTTKTLRPNFKDSKNWEDTGNIYIEGDNLDALKILLGSYRNSIKMIYIDPPYNTGHDFVYKDTFSEKTNEFLDKTNQLNEDGFLVENARTDGKYHSNWLNMMYPRLYLSRKLLTDDGVIFISIDDNEQGNLKKLCDEIFGEENFISMITREAIKGGSISKNIRNVVDYVLCYSKNINNIKFGGIKTKGITLNLKDEHGMYAKGRELNKWGAGSRRVDSPSMFYPIPGPNGEEVYPIRNDGSEGRWRLGKEKMFKLLQEDNAIFEKREDGTYIVYEKLRDDSPKIKQFTTLFTEKYVNSKGTEELKSLFDVERAPFDFAKPTNLIYDLILMADAKNDIILDFFSGSATTAHAVISNNTKENVNNKFIVVQLPEETDEKSEAYKLGYENICEIGKERIRRAGDKFLEESDNKDLDIGFKVFKVDESNFIPWNPIIETEKDAEQSVLMTSNNIVKGRSELDLIYELLLKLNMELTCSIEDEIINNHKIYVIDEGYAMICLDTNIDESIINDLLQLKEDLMTEYCQVILRDDAFNGNDELAINIYNKLNSEGVEFKTI